MGRIIAQIAEASWLKVILSGCALAAFYYYGSFNDGHGLREQYTAAIGQLKDAETKLVNTKKVMGDLERFKVELKVLTEKIDGVSEFMPETTDATSLEQMVTKNAVTAGARVTKVDPLNNDIRVDFFETTRINISVQGSFTQIVSFLSNLSKVRKLVTFDDAEITVVPGGASDNPKIKFVGVIVGYRYKGLDPAANPTANPIANPAAIPTEGGTAGAKSM
jgi:Tfp pilus assembly protein PilO